YKIANPTIFGRMDDAELRSLFTGYGYESFFVEGSEPDRMHSLMAETIDTVLDRIAAIQRQARESGWTGERPRWSMIILRSPKGWTGPKEVDGKKVEDFWRSHQVPVVNAREDDAHRRILEDWMRSYRSEELFDENGRFRPELAGLALAGNRRMGANPHA